MVSNVESRFATNPINLDMPRSTFDRSSSHKTTWNTGDLIPCYVDEVLPGDTFNLKMASAVRLQTLLRPPMDNLYMDTFFFFVPYRLVWSHWKEFMGENTSSPWIPAIQYTMPQVTPPTGGWTAGTIADYMGIPTEIDGLSVSALPFRAYSMIVNEWFRSEVVDDPVVINTGDSTTVGSNGTNYITDLEKGGMPFKVNKFFDYFTGALPSPQKGPDVLMPSGDAMPVVTMGSRIAEDLFPRDSIGRTFAVRTGDVNGPNGTWRNDKYMHANSGYTGVELNANNFGFTFNNLYALPMNSTMATINELRTAFQIQKFYEAQARGGSRYTEMIREFFRVTSPDARLQRPEYLGGTRRMINVNQVIQQSATDSTSPQGNLAGISLTTDHIDGFTKSFTEHGIIIGLVCCRYDHTYQQGIEKFWSRKTIFDYYWPTFANIGEQPILNKEIYAQGSSVVNPNTGNAYDDEVFGYQEAWAEYRYKPSRVSGEMRSNYAQSLDSWHFGDDYAALPALSSGWLKEDLANVDRSLAVTSAISNQFFGDFFFKCRSTRCMPVYSVPGLIDHH